MTRADAAALPHAPADFTLAQATALKALMAGSANEQQQKAALTWIYNGACRAEDLSFRGGPNSALDTAFAEGRRFAGLQIKKLVELTAEKMEALAAEEAAARSKETSRG